MHCPVFSTVRERKGSSIYLPIFTILAASIVYAFYGCLKNMSEKCSIISYLRLCEIAEWKNYFTVAQNEMFDRVYEQEMKGFEDFTVRLR